MLTPLGQGNIVINKQGRACLTDYGHESIELNLNGYFSTSPIWGEQAMMRWSAPEVLCGTPGVVSKAADVFAFAMVVVEVFTGKVPCSETPTLRVAEDTKKGSRPEMPEGITYDEMWGSVEKCWAQCPDERPTMQEVVEQWKGFAQNAMGSGAGSLQLPSGAEDVAKAPELVVHTIVADAAHEVDARDGVEATDEVGVANAVGAANEASGAGDAPAAAADAE